MLYTIGDGVREIRQTLCCITIKLQFITDNKHLINNKKWFVTMFVLVLKDILTTINNE